MSRPLTLPGPWAALAHALGGVQQLADACGVGRQAIYRWAHGTRAPGMVVRRHVNALARRRKLPLPYAEPSP